MALVSQTATGTFDVVESSPTGDVWLVSWKSAIQTPGTFFAPFGTRRVMNYWDVKDVNDPDIQDWIDGGMVVAAIANPNYNLDGHHSEDPAITTQDMVDYFKGKLGTGSNGPITTIHLDEFSRASQNYDRGHRGLDALEIVKNDIPGTKLYAYLTNNEQWATSTGTLETRIRQKAVDGFFEALTIEMYQECRQNCDWVDPDLSEIESHCNGWNNQSSPIVPKDRLNFTFWIGYAEDEGGAGCGGACKTMTPTYFQSQIDRFKQLMTGEHGVGFWFGGSSSMWDVQFTYNGATKSRREHFEDIMVSKYGL